MRTHVPENLIHGCDIFKWNFVLLQLKVPGFKLTDLLLIQDVIGRLDVEQDFSG